jgi:hypothetical protein
MSEIRQNRKLKGSQRQEDRQVKRLAISFMSLLIVATVLWTTGCGNFGSGQTQTGIKAVVGSTRQDHALKVRIDSLSWSWKSDRIPTKGETGAFSIEVEATIKNEGKCKLHAPTFSVDGGGLVSGSQAVHREDIPRGNEMKLLIANGNQLHLEFNNSDPGKEILLIIQATDQWGELYALSFTLPPPLDMPRHGNGQNDSRSK